MNQDSEENILQTIDAVKDFIALCINGKFTPLRGTKTLPDEEKALYNLAMGDSSPALSLLEALMDDHIDRAAVLPAGGKRDEMFAITIKLCGNIRNIGGRCRRSFGNRGI